MAEIHSEESCRELAKLYYRLVDIVESVSELRHSVRKLKNHPINDYSEKIIISLHFWWEFKGAQEYLLADVYEFLNDFKYTRNPKLKELMPEIRDLANEIIGYDKNNNS